MRCGEWLAGPLATRQSADPSARLLRLTNRRGIFAGFGALPTGVSLLGLHDIADGALFLGQGAATDAEETLEIKTHYDECESGRNVGSVSLLLDLTIADALSRASLSDGVVVVMRVAAMTCILGRDN